MGIWYELQNSGSVESRLVGCQKGKMAGVSQCKSYLFCTCWCACKTDRACIAMHLLPSCLFRHAHATMALDNHWVTDGEPQHFEWHMSIHQCPTTTILKNTQDSLCAFWRLWRPHENGVCSCIAYGPSASHAKVLCSCMGSRASGNLVRTEHFLQLKASCDPGQSCRDRRGLSIKRKHCLKVRGI